MAYIISLEEDTKTLLNLALSKYVGINPDSNKPSYSTVLKHVLKRYIDEPN